MKKMMKEQFLRFLQKTLNEIQKNKFTRLEQAKKKKTKPKRRRKTEGVSHKEMKNGSGKDTKKKHE